MSVSRLSLWATGGAQSYWRPSEEKCGEQVSVVLLRGKEAGYLSTSSHPSTGEVCALGINSKSLAANCPVRVSHPPGQKRLLGRKMQKAIEGTVCR